MIDRKQRNISIEPRKDSAVDHTESNALSWNEKQIKKKLFKNTVLIWERENDNVCSTDLDRGVPAIWARATCRDHWLDALDVLFSSVLVAAAAAVTVTVTSITCIPAVIRCIFVCVCECVPPVFQWEDRVSRSALE